MKPIKIVNKRLKELLMMKDGLVKKGRKTSAEIDVITKKIEDVKDAQRKYTNDCNPAELITKGDALQKKINTQIEELEKIGEQVQKAKLAAIPAELKKKYEDLKKQKEEKELERNKIALKVQKIKDRAIPIIQKEVKPFLTEYDDIETALIKGESIMVTTFNHLNEWKAGFAKKQTEETPIETT